MSLAKEESSYKLENDQEITIRPDDALFGVPKEPEWYTFWHKGIPLIIQKEDKFQQQNRMAFSPLPYQPLSLEGAVLLLLATKMSKTPEGQKHLKDIALKYLDSCARIVEVVQEAGKTNWAVGLNAQTATAAILHRLGLIDDGGYEKIVDQTRNIFDKEWTADFFKSMTGTLTTLVEGSKSETGATGIGALASILKGVGGAVV